MEKRKSTVILLASDNITNIGKPIGKLEYNKEGFDPHIVQTFELYITTNDEIKEGDWVYSTYGFVVQVSDISGGYLYHVGEGNNYLNCYKKIIAITDKSLKILNDITDTVSGGNVSRVTIGDKSLPQPSQAFIEKWIKEYNKGNIIDEVNVEYEIFDNPNFNRAKGVNITNPTYLLKLKVDSHNTITIQPIKDNWDREEVINILKLYQSNEGNKKLYISDNFNNWIKENL